MRFGFVRTESTKSTVQRMADTAWMTGLRQSMNWMRTFERTARKRNNCTSRWTACSLRRKTSITAEQT